MIRTSVKRIVSILPSTSIHVIRTTTAVRNITRSIPNTREYQANTIHYEKKMSSGCKCTDKKDRRVQDDRLIGPIELSILTKIEEELDPEDLIIRNDSWKHAHHTGMKGASNITESHFHVTIISTKFKELGLKTTISRHRYIFKLLDEELKNGIHGFQVVCKTPEEWEKLQSKEDDEKPARSSSGQYFS